MLTQTTPGEFLFDHARINHLEACAIESLHFAERNNPRANVLSSTVESLPSTELSRCLPGSNRAPSRNRICYPTTTQHSPTTAPSHTSPPTFQGRLTGVISKPELTHSSTCGSPSFGFHRTNSGNPSDVGTCRAGPYRRTNSTGCSDPRGTAPPRARSAPAARC